jgi:hypothetical protein
MKLHESVLKMRQVNSDGEEFSVYPPALPLGKLPFDALKPLSAITNPSDHLLGLKELITYRYAIDTDTIFTTKAKGCSAPVLVRLLQYFILEIEGYSTEDSAHIVGFELVDEETVLSDSYKPILSSALKVYKSTHITKEAKVLAKKISETKKITDLHYPQGINMTRKHTIARRLNLQPYELFKKTLLSPPHTHGAGLFNIDLFYEALEEFVHLPTARYSFSETLIEKLGASNKLHATDTDIKTVFSVMKNNLLSETALERIEKIQGSISEHHHHIATMLSEGYSVAEIVHTINSTGGQLDAERLSTQIRSKGLYLAKHMSRDAQLRFYPSKQGMWSPYIAMYIAHHLGLTAQDAVKIMFQLKNTGAQQSLQKAKRAA